MRITGWSIDGFGLHHDATVEPVAAGLTVIHGANETGKSTLVAFLRGMLFGFPDRRSRDNAYPPLRGGRHGGRVEIETPAGRVTIDRQVMPKRETHVWLPGGREGDESDLRRLVGGADAALYRSVFAFSLTELALFDTLTQDGVRDRIFAAGTGGAGRAAGAAMARLRAAREEYLNRRQERNQGRIQALAARLRELDTLEKAARREAEAYPAALAEEEKLAAELARLTARTGDVTEDRAHYETLIRLWPSWHGVEEARRQLAALPAITPETAAALELAALEVPAMRARASESDAAATELVHLGDSLARAIGELGPGWDASRLAAFDASLPRREEVRAWEEELAALARAAEDATRALEACDAAIRRVEARAADRTGPALPAGADTFEARAAALRRLRSRVAEHGTRSAALEVLAARARESDRALRELTIHEGWSPSIWTLALPLVLAAVLGVAAVIEFLKRGAFTGAALGELLGAVAGAAAFAVLARYRLRGTRAARRREEDFRALALEYEAAIEKRDAEEVQLVTLRTRIAEDAALLGLPDMPAFDAIEERDASLSEERSQWATAVRTREDLALIERELAGARKEREAAARRRDASVAAQAARVAAWDSWAASAGAPPGLAPRGVLDFFAGIEKARSLSAQLRKLEAAETARREALANWRERASALLVAHAPSGAGLPLEEVAGAILALHDQARRIEPLRSTIQAGEAALTQALGEGESARALRAELAAGELDRWRDELAARAAASRELDATRDRATRLHETARRRREELERSSDVARLQLEREAVIAELGEAVVRWRELTLAEALIEATRLRFLESRRPAVLADASRYFSAVTGGRYVRIDPGADEDEIVVVETTGARRDTRELSRGTAEQLYLCIRLGYAADFARRSVSLPLVMDDVLVNFDPERARAMAQAIVAFAREHQVLFFTCHPEVREMFRAADPSVAVIELGTGAAQPSPRTPSA